MADEEDRAETAASTPSQHEGADRSASKTTKDRQCPFCKQAFTSSSLGRHLDLYIKPKNPKPPDGVHKVDEIRKLRGGITRRQPRSGARASTSDAGQRYDEEQDDTPTHDTRASPQAEQRKSPVALSSESSRADDRFNNIFHSTSWQATGVMPNLPPRSASRNGNDEAPTGQAQRIQEMRRNVSGTAGNQRSERDTESIWKLQEAAEMGRITELALREVLGSLEAASKRSVSWPLFEDVDFFSLSFPGLCLALLPSPTTLFSPTPFPSPESWSMTSPSHKQFDVLNRVIVSRVEHVRQAGSDAVLSSTLFKHSAHLQGAYEHWEHSMSASERAAAWNLELCRAYATASKAKQQYSGELEDCRHRIRHLEAEYDRLSRCQLPRDYLLHPPQTLPIPTAAFKDAEGTSSGSAFAEMKYDADSILERWRTTVKTTTRRNPPPPPSQYAGPDRYDSNDTARNAHMLDNDMVANGAIFNVGGPIGPLQPFRGNVDAHIAKRMSDVEYHTPPQPGQVIEDSGQGEADVEPGLENDAARDDAGRRLGKGMPMKFYGEADFGPAGIGVVNGNSKRGLPTESSSTNGSSRGPKVLRERPAADVG